MGKTEMIWFVAFFFFLKEECSDVSVVASARERVIKAPQ